jgi:hypothetical protein
MKRTIVGRRPPAASRWNLPVGSKPRGAGAREVLWVHDTLRPSAPEHFGLAPDPENDRELAARLTRWWVRRPAQGA